MGYGMPFKRQFSFQGNPFAGGGRRPKYNVPINVIENEADYQVSVYATNFSKEDIKVSVVDDMLYISGSKSIDEKDDPDFVLQEFPIKNFERILALNGKVDTENISARSENQILILTLPKTKEAQIKEQKVEVK